MNFDFVHLRLTMDTNERVIIVGAGVFRLSTALRLKEGEAFNTYHMHQPEFVVSVLGSTQF